MKTKSTSKSNKLGTSTHPLKKGERVSILNTTFGGQLITEGIATIVAAADADDRYLVRFENGDVVERFTTRS